MPTDKTLYNKFLKINGRIKSFSYDMLLVYHNIRPCCYYNLAPTKLCELFKLVDTLKEIDVYIPQTDKFQKNNIVHFIVYNISHKKQIEKYNKLKNPSDKALGTLLGYSCPWTKTMVFSQKYKYHLIIDDVKVVIFVCNKYDSKYMLDLAQMAEKTKEIAKSLGKKSVMIQCEFSVK